MLSVQDLSTKTGLPVRVIQNALNSITRGLGSNIGFNKNDIVKLKLEENIREYLLKARDVIIYHEIIGIVIESYGVKDFKELLVNGFKENITLNFDEKGILEEIVYAEYK